MKRDCPLCRAEVEYLSDGDRELVMLDTLTVGADDLPDSVKWTVEDEAAVNLNRRWSEWRQDDPKAERPTAEDVRVEHRFLCPEQVSMTTVTTLPTELRDAVVERAVHAIKERNGEPETNEEGGA